MYIEKAYMRNACLTENMIENSIKTITCVNSQITDMLNQYCSLSTLNAYTTQEVITLKRFSVVFK